MFGLLAGFLFLWTPLFGQLGLCSGPRSLSTSKCGNIQDFAQFVQWHKHCVTTWREPRRRRTEKNAEDTLSKLTHETCGENGSKDPPSGAGVKCLTTSSIEFLDRKSHQCNRIISLVSYVLLRSQIYPSITEQLNKLLRVIDEFWHLLTSSPLSVCP